MCEEWLSCCPSASTVFLLAFPPLTQAYVLLRACYSRGYLALLQLFGIAYARSGPMGRTLALGQKVPRVLITDDHLAKAIDAFPGSVSRAWVNDIALLPAESMASLTRRVKTVELGSAALRLRIPGDFVECGTNMGGAAVLMLKTLQAQSEPGSRAFWVADSFQGLPDVSVQDWTDQTRSSRMFSVLNQRRPRRGDMAASRSDFQGNLRSHDVWEKPFANIHILEGWFNETLPLAPIESISFLRIDGSLYASTIQPLVYLYPKLQPGGLLYIDSYGSFPGCRNAVEEYRIAHRIVTPMNPILEPNSNRFEAVWWQKSSIFG